VKRWNRVQEILNARAQNIASGNPNASRPMTRRIQVRAWNNRASAEHHLLPSAGAIEMVAAHLFGLLFGLRLPDFRASDSPLSPSSTYFRRTSLERF
jgi:hypothetical protein